MTFFLNDQKKKFSVQLSLGGWFYAKTIESFRFSRLSQNNNNILLCTICGRIKCVGTDYRELNLIFWKNYTDSLEYTDFVVFLKCLFFFSFFLMLSSLFPDRRHITPTERRQKPTANASAPVVFWFASRQRSSETHLKHVAFSDDVFHSLGHPSGHAHSHYHLNDFNFFFLLTF